MGILYILWLLVGTSVALQVPLSYRYKYQATIANGSPSIGPQTVSTTIQMKVEIEMLDNGLGIGKFRRVKYLVNPKELCNIENSTLLEEERLSRNKWVDFTKPFLVNFANDREPIMQVSPDEPLWITNIRKSVVELLRVIPTNERRLTRPFVDLERNRFQTSDTDTPLEPKAFKRREPTIHGKCVVQYSLTPASPSDRNSYPPPSRDAQVFPEGNWPKISDFFYILHRSVDMGDCHDKPSFIQSSNSDIISNNTYDHYSDFLHQSTFGTFLLRGHNDRHGRKNLRMEKSEIQSNILIRPFGAQDSTLQVITNQTLALESVFHRKRKPQSPSLVPVPTLGFEITSPFKKPLQNAPTFIRYNDKKEDTYPVIPEMSVGDYVLNIDELKNSLLDLIIDTTNILRHTDTLEGSNAVPIITEHMSSVCDIIRAFPEGDLRDLFDLYKKISNGMYLNILIEGYLGSGSPAAISVLMENGYDTNFLTRLDILYSISSSLNSPVIFKKILESPNMSLESYILTAAKIFRRVCKLPDRPYYGNVYETACSLQNNFVTFIQKELTKRIPSTHKASLIYALGFLDSDESFKILSNVAISRNISTVERSGAIFTLVPQHMPSTRKEQILSLLTPILESSVEYPEIRQAALMNMLSWQPPFSWWVRLAKSSSRKESKAVAEFIYEVTKTVASLKGHAWYEQSKMAQNVLELTRPVLAPSQQSVLKIIETFITPPVMESETKLGWILNMKTMIPEKLFFSLNSIINDVRISSLEALFLGNNFEKWLGEARKIFDGQYDDRNRTSDIHLKQLIEDILSGIGNVKSLENLTEGLALVQLFSGQPIALHTPTIDEIQNFVRKLYNDALFRNSIYFFKYFNPIKREIIIPSSIGIPVVSKMQTPIVIHQNGEYEIKSGLLPDTRYLNIEATYSGNTIIAMRAHTSLESYIPWASINLKVGFVSENVLNMPNTTFGIRTTNGAKSENRNTLSAVDIFTESYMNDKISVAQQNRLPYVTMTAIEPGNSNLNTKRDEVIKIKELDKSIQKTRYPLPAYLSDIKGYYQYDEIEKEKHHQDFNPYVFLYPRTMQEAASRTATTKEVNVILDGPENGRIYGGLSFLYESDQRPIRVSLNETDHSDYDNYQNYGKYCLPGYYYDTGNFKIAPVSGSVLVMVTCSEVNNSHSHRNLLIFGQHGIRKGDNQYKENKTSKTIFMFYMPTRTVHHLVQDIPQLCLNGTYETPLLSSMDELHSLLSRPLSISTNLNLKRSENIFDCIGSKPPYLSLSANISISKEQLNTLAEFLPGDCNFDRTDPTTSLRRAAFYDSLDLNMSWKPNNVPSYIQNVSMALVDELQGILYPYSRKNCINASNTEDVINVNLTRSLGSKAASGWIYSQNCNQYIENTPVPKIIDMVLPLSGRKSFHGRHVSAMHPPSHQCYVLPNKIKTFDGVVYDIADALCESVLALHRSDRDSFIIMAGELELHSNLIVKMILPHLSLSVYIENQNLKVNNRIVNETHKILENADGEQIGRIEKSDETVTVSIHKYFKLKVRKSQNIVLELDERFRNSIRGLCGDYDRESWQDLKDPQECVYSSSDGPLFTASWSHLGCIDSQVRKNLFNHQWSCPTTLAELALPFTKEYNSAECEFRAHRVIPIGNEICLTTIQIVHCKERCREVPGTEREDVFEVKCWPERTAPNSILDAREVGYSIHFEEAHGRAQPLPLSHASECMPSRN